MTRGVVFNVQRFSAHDGPGLRTTVFLKGCPLRCAWCHNPEGLRPDPELLWDPGKCLECRACACAETDAEAAEACPSGAKRMAGRSVTVAELLEEVARDRIFFEESGGGVTFSGGEPLAQPAFLREALEACRSRGISTALDTCGYAARDDLLSAAALCDVVLFDLKGMDDARHRANTGVPASSIHANLTALAAAHPRVWLRIPLIPGRTDHPEELRAAAAFAASLRLERVAILPYHALGAGKTRLLERGAPRGGDATARGDAPSVEGGAPSGPATPHMTPAPTPDPPGATAAWALDLFRSAGLDARLGG